MLSVTQIVGPRIKRIAFAMAAVFMYLLLCLTLIHYGYLDASGSGFYPLLSVWSLGLLAAMFAEPSVGRFDAGVLTFIQALWFNVGVVCVALLVPHNLRPVLLVVPLFGVLYTALLLSRKHMVVVGVVTWLSYYVGGLVLRASGVADLSIASSPIEGLLLGVFTTMLLIMMYIGGEVTSLRSAFAKRSDRLNEAMSQLAELAMRDELTGLYNRRYIMDVLTQQQALANRGQVGFTLLYCDLDHFKRINDRFGHYRGDQVLCEFANLASEVVRSVDYVARIGGEEFLLVLVGADEREAMMVAERLGERTRNFSAASPEADFHLTVSTGIASFSPGERVEDVIQRADLALYRAKSEGRDQIIVAS